METAATTQRQIDEFGPQQRQVEEYKRVKADIEQKLSVIDTLADQRSGPVRMFDELATHIPERVWVSKIVIGESEITIQGMSLDNELVALFLTGLEDSAYFKDVELAQTEAREQEGYKLNAFEVSAKLTSPLAEKRAAEAAAAAAQAPGGGGKAGAGVARLTGQKL